MEKNISDYGFPLGLLSIKKNFLSDYKIKTGGKKCIKLVDKGLSNGKVNSLEIENNK